MREPEDAPVDVRADLTEPVWYWLKISDELVETVPQPTWESIGIRLLEAAPYEPGDRLSRWWRVEDRNAGPEYAGHKVDVIITRTDSMSGPEFSVRWSILDA